MSYLIFFLNIVIYILFLFKIGKMVNETLNKKLCFINLSF